MARKGTLGGTDVRAGYHPRCVKFEKGLEEVVVAIVPKKVPLTPPACITNHKRLTRARMLSSSVTHQGLRTSCKTENASYLLIHTLCDGNDHRFTKSNAWLTRIK